MPLLLYMYRVILDILNISGCVILLMRLMRVAHLQVFVIRGNSWYFEHIRLCNSPDEINESGPLASLISLFWILMHMPHFHLIQQIMQTLVLQESVTGLNRNYQVAMSLLNYCLVGLLLAVLLCVGIGVCICPWFCTWNVCYNITA